MALSGLRTGITIRQERVTASPNIGATTLPAVLVGVNRTLHYQSVADIFDWSAGTASTGVAFPGYISGTVEAGVANPTLAPKFYVRNSFGIADITANVSTNNIGDGSTGAPSFDISSGFSTVFEIATGTAGCFTVNTSDETLSAFKDTGADFVFDQVRRGDAIKVNGVQEYEVTGVVSDTELDVRRVGKGPETRGASEAAKMRLSPENTDDLRVLTTTSTGFESAGGFGPSGTKVKGGDLLMVDNWQTAESSGGLTYGYVGEAANTVIGSTTVTAADRVVNYSTGNSTHAAAVAAFNNSTGVGTVLFLSNDEDNFVAAMYAVSAVSSDEAVFRDFTDGPLVAASDSDSGDAYQSVTYSAIGGGVGSSTGSFTVRDTDSSSGTFEERTFSDATGTPFSSVSAGDHILVKDANDIFRPLFYVDVATDANNLQVKQFSNAEMPSAAVANNVSYKIVTFDDAQAAEYDEGGASAVTTTFSEDASLTTTASISLADYGSYVLTPDDRVLTDSNGSADYSGLTAGDLIFSDTGTLMFKVEAVPTANTLNKIIVSLHPNAGTSLATTATLANFGFTVRTPDLPVSFVVRRVISDTELEVKELSTSANSITGTLAINGMIWYQDTGANPVLPTSITVGDTSVGVSYTVEKTVSGGDLTGDILVSYAVIRDDLIGLQELTADNYASILGDDIPDNPLGLAARVYFSNSSNNLYVVQVKADTLEGWTAAAEATKSDVVYNVVPLTQTESVLAMWQAHVDEQSLPANKRERILWQSHRFLRDQVLATYSTASGNDTAPATVTRTAEGDQTITVYRDLLALSVGVGDSIEATMFDGTTYTDFTGRILNVSLAGSTTTLTVVPDGNVPLSTTNMVLSTYSVKQRPLSTAEIKDEVAAYPATIQSRRVRNVYPDQCVMQFSDNTGDGETNGFYGGGVNTATSGGHYMCVVEAAKRTAYGPSKPLTKRGGAGIYQILDTFAEAPGFQDNILDAGNYYMEQLGGVGANVQTLRALTTDTRELITAEESVTPQIDSFVRRLRTQLTPLLGPEILDQRFFDLISAVSQAVVTRALNEKELKTIKLLEITESPDTADTFLMKYEVTPYFSGARGIVTIYF